MDRRPAVVAIADIGGDAGIARLGDQHRDETVVAGSMNGGRQTDQRDFNAALSDCRHGLFSRDTGNDG
ncbi:hypothetical protein D3C71_1906250 [compost metagenome]